MSKYLYVIIPIVLLAAFVGFYIHESRVLDEQAKIKAAADKAEADQKAKELAEMRARSAAEAKANQEKREAEQRAKDKAKEDAFLDSIKKIKDQTAGYLDEQNKSKAQIADLEGQLTALRTEKENMARQSIDMNQSIVAALIERQNAEMEVQRYAATVARRASESPLTRPLVPTPPPTTSQ